jgi:hypothetical protein
MSKLTDIIGKVAPTVATVLGGPFAGMAIEMLGGALGISQPTQAKIESALASSQLNGEQLLALKKAEIDLQAKLADNGIRLEQIAVEDRDSARKMQIQQPSYWPGVLSAVTTLAVLAVIAARMIGATLPSDPTTVQLIGSLTTGWGLCLSYWFGTTRNSAHKDVLLAQSSPDKD